MRSQLCISADASHPILLEFDLMIFSRSAPLFLFQVDHEFEQSQSSNSAQHHLLYLIIVNLVHPSYRSPTIIHHPPSTFDTSSTQWLSSASALTLLLS